VPSFLNKLHALFANSSSSIQFSVAAVNKFFANLVHQTMSMKASLAQKDAKEMKQDSKLKP
jgi:hypothetical protein